MLLLASSAVEAFASLKLRRCEDKVKPVRPCINIAPELRAALFESHCLISHS